MRAALTVVTRTEVTFQRKEKPASGQRDALCHDTIRNNAPVVLKNKTDFHSLHGFATNVKN